MGYDGGIGSLAGTREVAEIGFPANAGAARHIGKAEAMTVIGMLKVIIDAFFFTQARDEMQIGLPVLYAVFAGGIVMKAFEGEGFSREILLFQNVRNNVRYVFVLENTMVLPRAEKPRYWRQLTAFDPPPGVVRINYPCSFFKSWHVLVGAPLVEKGSNYARLFDLY